MIVLTLPERSRLQTDTTTKGKRPVVIRDAAKVLVPSSDMLGVNLQNLPPDASPPTSTTFGGSALAVTGASTNSVPDPVGSADQFLAIGFQTHCSTARPAAQVGYFGDTSHLHGRDIPDVRGVGQARGSIDSIRAGSVRTLDDSIPRCGVAFAAFNAWPIRCAR
jgi:hypothetical protein